MMLLLISTRSSQHIHEAPNKYESCRNTKILTRRFALLADLSFLLVNATTTKIVNLMNDLNHVNNS